MTFWHLVLDLYEKEMYDLEVIWYMNTLSHSSPLQRKLVPEGLPRPMHRVFMFVIRCALYIHFALSAYLLVCPEMNVQTTTCFET